MDVTQLYAIVAGGLFAILTILNFCFRLWQTTQNCTILMLQYIIYPFFLRRHRLLGPWSRAGFLLRLIYFAANVFCSGFNIGSVAQAGDRTGTLSLINMIPLFLGPHLSFLAGIFGISLQTFQSLHGSSAVVSVLLSAAHAGLGFYSSKTYPLREVSHLYGLIGVSSLVALLLFSPQCFHRPSYEFFLRGHQACSVLAAYAIWRHIAVRSAFPGMCVYIAPGIFVLTVSMETFMAIYRNFTLSRGHTRASISKIRGAIRMKIDVPRSWSIQAGQYVNIWLPGVGFRAWFETHPFMIASWTTQVRWDTSDAQLTTLQLLIEPRDGFTRRLLRRAEATHDRPEHLLVYSGPHGSPASMKDYGSVLMIASGFGVAAHLPYIKELLDGYNACEIVTRRVHLVWQLREQGDEMVAKDLIDDALVKDSLNYGWMLQISIYYSSSYGEWTEIEGEHGRLAHHGGTLDPEQILTAEMSGDYDRYIDGTKEKWTGKERGDILVAVSAHGELRDDMRSLVDANIKQRVRFVELEYQP